MTNYSKSELLLSTCKKNFAHHLFRTDPLVLMRAYCCGKEDSVRNNTFPKNVLDLVSKHLNCVTVKLVIYGTSLSTLVNLQ